MLENYFLWCFWTKIHRMGKIIGLCISREGAGGAKGFFVLNLDTWDSFDF